jgi:hypothetical protein
MAKTRVLLRSSMVFIVAAVGACSYAADLVTDRPDRDRQTSRSASSIDDDSVEALLEVAQQALRSDVTGRFVRKVTYRPEEAARSALRHSAGSYDIEHRRLRGAGTLIDLTGGDPPLPYEFASSDRQRLVRAVGWPCWVVLPPDRDSPIAELDPVPGHAWMPGEIAGFLRAEPTNFASDGPSDVIEVLIPLRTVVGLIKVSVYRELTGRLAGIPVPAKIHLESGRFASWSVSGRDLGYAAASFGIVADLESDFSRTNVRVTLRDVGTSGPVRLPPRSDRARMPPRSEDLDAIACEQTTV